MIQIYFSFSRVHGVDTFSLIQVGLGWAKLDSGLLLALMVPVGQQPTQRGSGTVGRITSWLMTSLKG